MNESEYLAKFKDVPNAEKPFSGYVCGNFYIPERMIGGLERYRDDKVAPGGFLVAVLRNDLSAAVQMADEENIRNLPAFMSYLYNELPAGSYGSKWLVEKWLDSKKKTRKRRTKEPADDFPNEEISDDA